MEITIEKFAFYALLYVFLGNSFKSLLLFVYEIKDNETPPVSINIVVWSEIIYGIILLFLSLFCLPEHKVLSIVSVISGAFCIWLAQKIYYAHQWSKSICVILSIIRIPTLFGIPFSVLSIINLFFTKSSRIFFSLKYNYEESNQETDNKFLVSHNLTELSDKTQEDNTDQLSSFIGCTAKTITAMKPSGFISIDDKKYPAITEGGFIEPGITVVIYQVKNCNIIVRTINDD